MDEQVNSSPAVQQQVATSDTPITQASISNSLPQQTSYRSRLFTGRVNRRNYIAGMFLVSIGPVIMIILLTYFTNNGSNSVVYLVVRGTLLISNLAFGFVALVVGLSLVSRRLHDLNKRDLYFLLNFIPFVNILLYLYMTFWSGTPAVNKYGPPSQKDLSFKQIYGLV